MSDKIRIEDCPRPDDESAEGWRLLHQCSEATGHPLPGSPSIVDEVRELRRRYDEALRFHSVLHDCASEAQHMHTMLRTEHSCAVDAINAWRTRALAAERDHDVTKASCTDTTLRLMQALRERDAARAAFASLSNAVRGLLTLIAEGDTKAVRSDTWAHAVSLVARALGERAGEGGG